ncbi:MAG: hypothetical protein IAE80_15810 [Anaerolinea sp.]|nr:hypothetical protein [Anaerolinea sp.]
MKYVGLLILWIGAALALSACNFFSQPADLQTENLENQVANTEIAAVRQTATVNADRLLITLAYAQTSVSVLNQQGTRIASTLVAAGMLMVDTSGITAVAPTPNPGGNPGANPPAGAPAGGSLITPIVGEGAARSNIEIQQPPSPTPLATADPNVPRLGNFQLAGQVGVDDCPLGATTSFSSTATEIYATAIAYNVRSGDLISTRWLRDGTEIATYDWQPSFDIEQACIWFYLPASEVEFVPGNWSVEFTLNGAAAGSPVAFTITDQS